MKRILLFTFISILFFTTTAFAKNINIYVNEAKLECSASPYIENGYTMVPMRAIFQAFDAKISWDNKTKIISVNKDSDTILLKIDSKNMYVNNTKHTLETAPSVVNGTTYVPVRAVSKGLNADIKWSSYRQTVYINSPNKYEEESKVTMYASDGRTLEVLTTEVEAYKNVGWYTQPQKQVQANTSVNNYDTVYITPTGKRYHKNKSCSGKNAQQSTLDNATAKGLTPCKKCAT